LTEPPQATLAQRVDPLRHPCIAKQHALEDLRHQETAETRQWIRPAQRSPVSYAFFMARPPSQRNDQSAPFRASIQGELAGTGCDAACARQHRPANSSRRGRAGLDGPKRRRKRCEGGRAFHFVDCGVAMTPAVRAPPLNQPTPVCQTDPMYLAYRLLTSDLVCFCVAGTWPSTALVTVRP
jgi:hypothetical protein